MLSSLKSREGGDHEDHHHHHHLGGHTLPSSAHAGRQLLITAAELVHRSDLPAARRGVSFLLSAISPSGDCTDRLVHQFARALSLRIDYLSAAAACFPSDIDDLAANNMNSSYLSLNQVTPFLRFAHLTANQAILEAIEGSGAVHILDFDTGAGLQWPPFLQALADRSSAGASSGETAAAPPPTIRITGTGDDIEALRRTGDRLRTFARSIDLSFEFHPLHLPVGSSPSPINNETDNNNDNRSSFFQLHPGETLAVNCVLFLHKLLSTKGDYVPNCRGIGSFLDSVKAMRPTVVTVAEREASHSSPIFLQRFTEALDYYSAVFESLEATLPPKSRERVAVEQAWLSREIAGVIAGRERHERFQRWEAAMRAAGFRKKPPSQFAESQARLLLRLHYPSEGYQIQTVEDSSFLGWKQKPLFSVSSWH